VSLSEVVRYQPADTLDQFRRARQVEFDNVGLAVGNGMGAELTSSPPPQSAAIGLDKTTPATVFIVFMV
jgi:hypothetical protein